MPIRTAWNKSRTWLVHLLHLDDSAHRIALGVAIGMFVAMTPTWGLQMMLTVGLAWLFRANKAAGVPCAWITNPLTGVPIYSFCYAVGHALVGGPSSGEFVALLTQVHAGATLGAMARGWWDLMVKAAAPLWVGCVVVGAAAGAASYVALYYFITAHRRRHGTPRAQSKDRDGSPLTGPDQVR